MDRAAKSRYCFYIVSFMLVFFVACASKKKFEEVVAVDPCPDSDSVPALGTTSGPGELLFFTGCGIWAVDPASPESPGQIESHFSPEAPPNTPKTPHIIPGSLQKIVNGTWNVPAQKLTEKHLHSILYAKGEGLIASSEFFDGEKLDLGDKFREGRFYKISALKNQSQIPVQVSSEDKANEMCGVITVLEDYQDINNSLYVYTMPGPDGDCGIADDNEEKYIKLGMGEFEDPITLPRGRDMFWIRDLVDKNNGAIIGWLAVKTDRKQKRLPTYTAQAYDDKDVLKPHKAGTPLNSEGNPSRPYPLGFSTGTPILISGAGLDPNTSYFVNHDIPTKHHFVCPASEDADTVKVTFPETPSPIEQAELFDENLDTLTTENALNLKLKRRIKLICLADGTVIGESIEDSNSDITITSNGRDTFSIPFDASDDVLTSLDGIIGDRRVVKTAAIEVAVDIKEKGTVTLNAQANYIDLHRCNLEMTDCSAPLKETSFQTFCAEDGFDQMGSEEDTLTHPFVIGAYDRYENPVNGDVVKWGLPEEDCNIFGFNCEQVFVDTEIGDFGPGKTSHKGTLGDDDEKSGWNTFSASISGIGSPLTFSASKPDQDRDGVLNDKDICPNTPSHTHVNSNGCPDPDGVLKEFTPPYCKTREEFYILRVFAPSTRGSKAAFRGKVVLRIDLLNQPFWQLIEDDEADAKKREKAKKRGTQGVLYVYDINDKTFSPDVQYKTNLQVNKNALKYVSEHEISDGDKSAFPEGLLGVYDSGMFYFSDYGKLYNMPLTNNDKAVERADEGDRKILDMKLTTTSLVYTRVDMNPTPPISAVRSINKAGGGAIDLLGNTPDAVLNLITDPDWNYVYFQTLKTEEDLDPDCTPDPEEDGCGPGIHSQIFAARADGSELPIKETKSAIMAGRTETRVLSVLNCNSKGLYTCKDGTLVSTVGTDRSNDLSLGTLPNDIDAIDFQGVGEDLLGEGYFLRDGFNVDIFHIRADRSNSLTRSVSTPDIPEGNL